MTNWQVVVQEERPRRGRYERVYASLNKRGEIVLNPAVWGWIGGPASVTLLYDAAAKAIAVKYPVPADHHFFPMRRYGRGRKLRIVRAAQLLKQFGIEVAETLVFCHPEPVEVNGAPAIILELEHTRVLGR